MATASLNLTAEYERVGPSSQYSKFQTSTCVQSVDMILQRLTF